jgi:hypothetical protein
MWLPRTSKLKVVAFAFFFVVGTTTPWLANAAEVGNIEVCYFCSNNFDSLGVLDGPTFEINNLTSTALTNVLFTANGDTYNVGTITGNASVFLVPGVSMTEVPTAASGR